MDQQSDKVIDKIKENINTVIFMIFVVAGSCYFLHHLECISLKSAGYYYGKVKR